MPLIQFVFVGVENLNSFVNWGISWLAEWNAIETRRISRRKKSAYKSRRDGSLAVIKRLFLINDLVCQKKGVRTVSSAVRTVRCLAFHRYLGLHSIRSHSRDIWIWKLWMIGLGVLCALQALPCGGGRGFEVSWNVKCLDDFEIYGVYYL